MTSLLEREDFYASFYTLSGAPASEPSRFSLRARAEAAAEAGLAGIGLSVQDYLHLLDVSATSELRSVLDATGVRIFEIEFLYGWERGGDGEPRWRYYEERLLEMAHELGAAQLNIAILDPTEPTPSVASVTEQFRDVCDRAAEAGVNVVLEPMAVSHFKHVSQAEEVVAGAAASNGGILVDSYHFFRSGDSLATLAQISPEHITAVQVADAVGPAPADLVEECVTNRKLPGEGTLPIAELLAALGEMEVDVPIAVEVFSSDLQRRPVREAAEHTAAAVARVQQQARDTRRGGA